MVPQPSDKNRQREAAWSRHRGSRKTSGLHNLLLGGTGDDGSWSVFRFRTETARAGATVSAVRGILLLRPRPRRAGFRPQRLRSANVRRLIFWRLIVVSKMLRKASPAPPVATLAPADQFRLAAEGCPVRLWRRSGSAVARRWSPDLQTRIRSTEDGGIPTRKGIFFAAASGHGTFGSEIARLIFLGVGQSNEAVDVRF